MFEVSHEFAWAFSGFKPYIKQSFWQFFWEWRPGNHFLSSPSSLSFEINEVYWLLKMHPHVLHSFSISCDEVVSQSVYTRKVYVLKLVIQKQLHYNLIIFIGIFCSWVLASVALNGP